MRDCGAARGTIVALALGLTLVGCGHPEQRVVDQYFGAVNQKDNQTLSSFAVGGLRPEGGQMVDHPGQSREPAAGRRFPAS